MILISILLSLVLINSLESAKIAPKLGEIITKRSQNVGTKLKILCSIQEGSKPISFEWRKDEHILVPGANQHFHIESAAADESQFVIQELVVLDSGNYTCSARNEYGSDQQTTWLTVKGLLGWCFPFAYSFSHICL